MEKVFKVFNAEIKSVDHEAQTVEVIVSTGAVDRHLESVNPDAFRKRLATYKSHPVLLSSHDYNDLRKQIGEAESIKVKDGALVAKFKYYAGLGNSEADWAFMLASKKVAAFSIGFIGHGFEDTKATYEEARKDGVPLRIYTDVELIEISQVLIPSNRDAVQERKTTVEHEIETAKTNSSPLHVSAEAMAELCTKALANKELLPETPAAVVKEPVVTLEQVKTAVAEMKAELAEVIKTQVVEIIKADKDLQKEIALAVVGLLKSGVEKNLLKDLLIDAVEEITADEFYRELLFGKVAQKSPQPTPSNLCDELKQIARSL